MSTAALNPIASEEAMPERARREATRLMTSAVQPSADLQARIQARRIPSDNPAGPGWEFYEIIDQDPCHICYVPDTAAGVTPEIRVSSRYSQSA